MSLITTIKRADYPSQFNDLIDDFYTDSYEDHRKYSTFWKRSIVHLDDEYHPNFPELWGFWETNTYMWSDSDGYDKSEINLLTRVEKAIRTIEETYWKPIQQNENDTDGFIEPEM